MNRRITSIAGFTLLEVIVVVTTIGVLASAAIISYGGWRKAIDVAQVKSDLNGVAAAMENARNFGNGYPSDIINLTTFTPSSGTVLSGGSSDGGKTYCIDAIYSSDLSIVYHITNSDQEAQEGDCDS